MITDGLNPEQVHAVKTTQGPLLILAGAGSGKTSVMTRRIAYILEQKLAEPWNILAITFTNKAAREMNDRVKKLVGKAAQDIWMSTFHAMCVKILRRESEHLGFENTFTILDSDDQITAIKQCMLDLNYDLKKFDPAAVHWKISAAKNELKTPSQMKTKRRGKASLMDSVAVDVYQEYQAKLKMNNALDFDDLIFKTVELFETKTEVLQAYQDKFRYIHVDEYQDTNRAQYQLVQMLADKHQNLCVVGDSDQAIYRWRGADISNILNFERDYPDATVIKLEQNYRSTQTILDAANAVIRNNKNRKEKRLWSQGAEGDKIAIYSALDQSDEAVYIVSKVQEHVGSGGKYEDCTVLYRANALSRAIEEAFMQAAVPYKIIGGMTFYDRREIKDVMAYLKVLSNPQDEISLLRIVNIPKRGIGDGTIRRLLDYAHERDLTLLEAMGRTGDEEIQRTSTDAQRTGNRTASADAGSMGGDTMGGDTMARPVGENVALPRNSAEAVKKFHRLMMLLMEMQEGLTVTEFVQEVLHKSQYKEQYAASHKEEDQSRLENIEELLTVTRAFDRRRHGTLTDFLAETSLLSDVDKESDKSDHAVRMMTMHASKGLEFPVVFLVGAEETIFPHARSMETDEDVEEERNLCYVAITRAREKLHISYCAERSAFGQVRMNDPSRFLAELPEDLTERKQADFDMSSNWNIGLTVRHPLYGVGIVTDMGGSDDDVELTITFHSKHGTKTVKPKSTRLRIIDR